MGRADSPLEKAENVDEKKVSIHKWMVSAEKIYGKPCYGGEGTEWSHSRLSLYIL